MVNLWMLHNQSTGEQLQADEFINSLWTAIEAGMIGRLRLLKHTSNLSHLFLDCGNPGTLPHQCNTHHHTHITSKILQMASVQSQMHFDFFFFLSWHQTVLKCSDPSFLPLLISYSECVLIFCLSSSPAESYYYCSSSNLISPQESSII